MFFLDNSNTNLQELLIKVAIGTFIAFRTEIHF